MENVPKVIGKLSTEPHLDGLVRPFRYSPDSTSLRRQEWSGSTTAREPCMCSISPRSRRLLPAMRPVNSQVSKLRRASPRAAAGMTNATSPFRPTPVITLTRAPVLGAGPGLHSPGSVWAPGVDFYRLNRSGRKVASMGCLWPVRISPAMSSPAMSPRVAPEWVKAT